MNSVRTCHAEASVDLPLDPQTAWDIVVDWDRQSRWMLLTRVWATENDGVGIGGGVVAKTSVGPVGFTDDMVITHWDPPRECTVKHLGTIVRGTGTFAVRPAAGTDTPTAATDTPTGGTDTPSKGTGTPAAGTLASAAGTGTPAVGTDTPIGGTDMPTVGTETPTADTPGAGGASTVTWSEDVVPPLGKLGVAVWPVVRPVFEVMMRASLRRLVREVAR